MEFGAAIFFTDYAMGPIELGRALEYDHGKPAEHQLASEREPADPAAHDDGGKAHQQVSATPSAVRGTTMPGIRMARL